VDLRAFVYATGTGPDDVHLADVALTRVAPEGSMVVNSSQGGGAKDTWIVGNAPADTEGER
jgi:carboxylate-amine ligase